MERPIRSICIVGGGTAGWRDRRHHRGTPPVRHPAVACRSPWLKAETIGIIGVGEGTWPTMRSTLRKVGISETGFFRECNVSFEGMVRQFARWVTGQASDFYYHPLMLPEGFPSLDLAPSLDETFRGASRCAFVLQCGLLSGSAV